MKSAGRVHSEKKSYVYLGVLYNYKNWKNLQHTQ